MPFEKGFAGAEFGENVFVGHSSALKACRARFCKPHAKALQFRCDGLAAIAPLKTRVKIGCGWGTYFFVPALEAGAKRAYRPQRTDPWNACALRCPGRFSITGARLSRMGHPPSEAEQHVDHHFYRIP